jgi:hypothetical protein
MPLGDPSSEAFHPPSGSGFRNRAQMPPISPVAGPWEALCRDRPWLEVAAWCVFYVAIFTATQMMSHGPGDLANDTLEAFAWGQHFEFGYSKHPPFWAWLAGGWFKIFPTADWAAYLLGSLNASIGLACSWCIGRRFLSDDRATGAMLCLMLSTSYVCLAQRFNANTMLLSLWPAATLVTLRAVERNRLRDGALAGLLAAACLLSKYHSAIFLLSLLVAVCFIAGTAKVLLSRAALASYAVASLALVPHLVWLKENDFLPLTYMADSTARSWNTSLRESIVFVVTSAGFMAAGLVAYFWATGTGLSRLPVVLVRGFSGRRLALAILIFATGLLTIASCLARSSTIRPIYAIPMYFMVPFWLAMAEELPFDGRALNRLRAVVLVVFLGCLAFAPVLGFVFAWQNQEFVWRPRAEIAAAVTQEWHRRFGRPLKLVAGDEDYAIAAPFYSLDHPAYLIGFDNRVLEDFGASLSHGPANFNPIYSPWADAAAIKRDGMAIICSEEHWHIRTGCIGEAERWLGTTGILIELSAGETDYFTHGPVYKFRIFFLPPA